MKRFKFRLERLERWRLALRREAEVKLAAANAALAGCCERRETLGVSVLNAEERWEEASSMPGPDTHTLRLLSGYLEGLQSALVEHLPVERRAEERVASCEAEHVVRARAHRALEKLRKRTWLRWLDEAASFEQRCLDELHRVRRAAARDGEEVPRCDDRSAGS